MSRDSDMAEEALLVALGKQARRLQVLETKSLEALLRDSSEAEIQPLRDSVASHKELACLGDALAPLSAERLESIMLLAEEALGVEQRDRVSGPASTPDKPSGRATARPHSLAAKTQTPEHVDAPPLGTVLGEGYELRHFLGAGGVGAVYEALAPDGGRVALKVLLEAAMRADSGQIVARFKREADITAKLDSPHIVPALDAGFDSALSVPFMVMPLLVGLDLRQLLERTGPLHPAVAARIARQACSALAVAHRAGVVHRDIKPANIFLDHSPEGVVMVRLLDFGLAKWHQKQDTAVTASDSILGTPHFMAPEQIESAKTVDARSDIYSLGASLYCALCDAAPFKEARTLGTLLRAVLTECARPLQDRAPWVDPALAVVVHGTLLRDKEARCPSAAQLAAALQPFTEGTDELAAGMLQPLAPEQLEHRAEPAQLPARWQLISEPQPPSTRAFEITQPADDPLIGRTIAGRYQVLRSLGSGGMGTVYEVRTAGGDRLALKVINAEAAGQGSEVQRFVREARGVTTISSPHVVRVVEVDTDIELQLPFIAMEMLVGADLAMLIKQHGALPPPLVARLFVQACRGLGAAHAEGFVHRDIKPANLFVHQLPQGECVVKICDFGVVTRLHGEWDESMSLSNTRGVIGSPAYLSPEQSMSAPDIDLRTDIWSLGVALFQTLSGTHPWNNQSTIGEVIVAICTAPIPHLQDRAPWIAPGLAEVVRRAMAREPDGRFQSMEELAQALLPFTQGMSQVLRNDLRAVSSEVRAKVKPRAAGIAAGGDVIAADRAAVSGGITASTMQLDRAESLAVPRSRIGLKIALGAAAVAGAATGAFFLLREPAPAAQPVVGADSAATSIPPNREHRVAVAISPTGAEVTVDGKRRRIGADGKLWLSGKPTKSFVVVVAQGGQELVRVVTIDAAGNASVSRLSLPATTAASSTTAAPSTTAAHPTSSTATSAPAESAEVPDLDVPRISEGWDRGLK